MNDLIKLAVVIGVIYFGYSYYRDNISVVGKAVKKQKDTDNTNAINKKAEEMKLSQNALDQVKCNSRYSAGIYEWTDVERCKDEKRMELNMVDWYARAKQQLGL